MGKLADKMRMDMDLRNLSPRTKSCYLRHMRAFARHYQASPDGLGEEEIRGYLHHLIVQRNASQATVSQAYSALKFFYMKTLGRDWDAGRLPRSKKAQKLPVVLSPQEVAAILQAVTNLKHRTVLTVIYAGGLRLKEAVSLRPEHIDADSGGSGKGTEGPVYPFRGKGP